MAASFTSSPPDHRFKQRPMLLHALADHYQLSLSETSGTLEGLFSTSPGDREAAAYLMFDDPSVARRLGKGTHLTRLAFNPREVSRAQFAELSKGDICPRSDNAGPDASEDCGRAERPAWNQPYSRDATEDEASSSFRASTEQLLATAVAFSPDNEPVGFFDFSVSLSYYSDDTMFMVDLPLVYVRPGFRTRHYGLDLAMAVAYCTQELYDGVCRQYQRRVPLRSYLHADFNSKGGERIAQYIASELRVQQDMVREDFPAIASRLDKLVCDMGY